VLTVALLIKRSSPGPVIFKQIRQGWNDQVIKLYKFIRLRSLYINNWRCGRISKF
jgi:putative colanic acid biosynthesis UDP-glucose lipid carrier transferase